MGKYRKILVPLDGSSTADRGLDEAIRMAGLNNGRLRLLYVVDDLSVARAVEGAGTRAGAWQDDLQAEADAVLQRARARAVAGGVEADVCVRESSSGVVFETILDEARRCAADLIVMGTHGRRGIGRALLGSSAENVVRHAELPVLLVRPAPGKPLPAAAQTVPAVEPPLRHVRQPVGALSVE